VDRDAWTFPRQARRECITESQPVGKGTKGVQPDVGCDSGPTGFHHNEPGAVSVQFGDALLVRDRAVSPTTLSPTRRAVPRTRADQVRGRREEAGFKPAFLASAARSSGKYTFNRVTPHNTHTCNCASHKPIGYWGGATVMISQVNGAPERSIRASAVSRAVCKGLGELCFLERMIGAVCSGSKS